VVVSADALQVSGVHCAVKIIDKTTIEPEEKGAAAGSLV
jgi:hypothetical protein